jgi:hypothetical protein
VPFNPNKAVERFVRTLKSYGGGITHVTGDKYAGETFRSQFIEAGIGYTVASDTKSELYEALEPRLNAGAVILLDVPTLEQQLLGLVWRGGTIDHQPGEHDDFANAAAGVVHQLVAGRNEADVAATTAWALRESASETNSRQREHPMLASAGCPRP